MAIKLCNLEIQVEKVHAYQGAHGRVFATEYEATVDLATDALAKKWLSVCCHGQGSFQQYMGMLEADLELAKMAVGLAQYKHERIK